MTRRAMGLHVQGTGANVALGTYIRAVRPSMVKWMAGTADPALVALAKSVGAITVMRVYWENQDHRNLDVCLGSVERAIRAHPGIDAFEVSFNEADQAGDDLAWKAAADVRGMELCERHGKRAVIGSFSVGMPDLAEWPRYLPALARAATGGHYLGLHEYGGGSAGMRAMVTGDGPAARGWAFLRYRRVLDWARSVGQRMPRILITEAGIDVLGQADRPTRGFQTVAGVVDYPTQLRWCSERLAEDADAVAGWCDFGWSADDPQWWAFDLSRDGDALARTMNLQAAIPDTAPQPIPGGTTMAPIRTVTGHHYSSRMGQRPRYLVLHSAANSANATAESVARYLAQNAVQASAHYLAGDGVIWKIVDESWAAHHAGGSTLPDGTRGTLRDGAAFVDAVNAATIGVEMLQTAGQSVKPAVLETAIPLLVDICRRNGIPASNVVSHAAISVHAPQGAHSDPVGVDMGQVRTRIAAALSGGPNPVPAPPVTRGPDMVKVTWFLEETQRRMEREGLIAESKFVGAHYTSDAIARRNTH